MIETIVDSKNNLTKHICSGVLTVADLQNEIRQIYRNKPTDNHLWDLLKSDFSSLSGDDIRMLAELPKELVPDRRGGKTAIVAMEAIGFGLSRMYEICAEAVGQSVDIKVFRSMEDALGWLNCTRT
jgi:hypothetical protein